jgi:hypothetical protein
MSPITAKLKCPHEGGETFIESKAVTEVASHEDGGGREDHLEGGKGEGRFVLPPGHTDLSCPQGERNPGVDSRQYGSAVPPSNQRGVKTEGPPVVQKTMRVTH